jgi:hypothetical protein
VGDCAFMPLAKHNILVQTRILPKPFTLHLRFRLFLNGDYWDCGSRKILVPVNPALQPLLADTVVGIRTERKTTRDQKIEIGNRKLRGCPKPRQEKKRIALRRGFFEQFYRRLGIAETGWVAVHPKRERDDGNEWATPATDSSRSIAQDKTFALAA